MNMASTLKLNLPITNLIYRILYEGLSPEDGIAQFRKLVSLQPTVDRRLGML